MATARNMVIAVFGLFFLGAVQGAAANTYVDFRSEAFSDAMGLHSISGSTSGVDFTVSAWDDGEKAELWWDKTDGLGIRGGTNDDEIDRNEHLTIDFATSVGISSLTFSDLFLNEGATGEHGYVVFESAEPISFHPEDMVALAAGNGEYRLVLDQVIQVDSLSMGAASGYSDFALQGFTEDSGVRIASANSSVTEAAETASVPEPGVLALFGLGLVAMGATVRRCKNIWQKQ